MQKRFVSCGLNYVEADDVESYEHGAEAIELARPIQVDQAALSSKDIWQVLWNAIHLRMVVFPQYAPFRGRLENQIQFLRFRPGRGFPEEGTSIVYEFFQIPLLRSGGCDYGYVVIALDTETGVYTLAGVSKPMSVYVPEYSWCNSDDTWLYWNKEATPAR